MQRRAEKGMGLFDVVKQRGWSGLVLALWTAARGPSPAWLCGGDPVEVLATAPQCQKSSRLEKHGISYSRLG